MDAEIPEGHEGPLRLCAATRAGYPIDELIRFVAGPDGEIVPDLACRLPGRGVWIKAERSAVDAAVRQKVFTKSLKRQVNVDPDLAGRVARLLADRTVGALALANKAGLVTTGYAQVDALVESGAARALLHGSDSAAGGRDKLNRKFVAIASAAGRPHPVVNELTIEQMSLAMGRANVVHAALAQGGATEKFLSEAGRLERYRSRVAQPADLTAAATKV